MRICINLILLCFCYVLEAKKVLIVGQGGREHALAWKIAQSAEVSQVFVAPGNAGTAQENKIRNIDIAATDLQQLVEFVQRNNIDFTIVGPELPLSIGIVDYFTVRGLRCFGPLKKVAQLETSKVFAKNFMRRHHIPTAVYQIFDSFSHAVDYVYQHDFPLVIKADGLAGGKGVIIAFSQNDAIKALKKIMIDRCYGDAGDRVIIEEFIKGEEVSFIVLVDGKHILPLATSQDYKKRDDGEKGPNTGGMGACSPAFIMTSTLHERIIKKIIQPTINGLLAEGYVYKGFLYVGLMITPEGDPKVLEFNCRLGDPEAQVLMMRLETDLASLCEAALDGELDTIQCKWKPEIAISVVLANRGYPKQYHIGEVIQGLDQEFCPEVKIFHSGTCCNNSKIVTSGGRVLCVTALGDSRYNVRKKLYQVIDCINWKNKYCRIDIGLT